MTQYHYSSPDVLVISGNITRDDIVYPFIGFAATKDFDAADFSSAAGMVSGNDSVNLLYDWLAEKGTVILLDTPEGAEELIKRMEYHIETSSETAWSGIKLVKGMTQ